MESVAPYALIGGIIAVVIGYQWMLRHGMRTRTVATTLDDESLRQIFVRHVAGSTWKIVADGEPMVAQSPILAGIRQQIAMQLGDDPAHPGRTVARVMVIRHSTKVFGGPTKAHTLRIRMNSFMRAVRKADPSATDLTDGAGSSAPRTAKESSGGTRSTHEISGLTGSVPSLPAAMTSASSMATTGLTPSTGSVWAAPAVLSPTPTPGPALSPAGSVWAASPEIPATPAYAPVPAPAASAATYWTSAPAAPTTAPAAHGLAVLAPPTTGGGLRSTIRPRAEMSMTASSVIVLPDAQAVAAHACPVCSHDNDPVAAFCTLCGTRLAA